MPNLASERTRYPRRSTPGVTCLKHCMTIKMRICGISFEPSSAAVAIIECSQSGTISLVDSETKRIPLDDHQDSDCLRSFVRTVNALVRDFAVDSIAIRKCTYSGKYQSGAASLKMEALLQVADVTTALVSPQTVASRCKSNNFTVPENLKKYQHDAFKVAFAHATQAMDQQK